MCVMDSKCCLITTELKGEYYKFMSGFHTWHWRSIQISVDYIVNCYTDSEQIVDC